MYHDINTRLIEGKEMQYFSIAKSVSWSQPSRTAFQLLKTNMKAERPSNKQQMKATAVKAWQSISRKENQNLVMSVGSRHQAVIKWKGFSSLNSRVIFITMLLCPKNLGILQKMSVIPKNAKCHIIVNLLKLSELLDLFQIHCGGV